ncbi:MAG: BlaI/MecI/CopY family transcriptional regulator [Planctomycetota bacterium]|jgi:predicted transcriptional regulator
MTHRLLDDLGRLQRAVMEAVWDLGEASVHEVRNRLAGRKKLAYTTILSSMQKLEKAGWLQHRNRGKSYIYVPTKTREQAGARSVRKFVDRMFDGSAVLMFQHLMSETNLSDTELAELRKMIDQTGKERKK